jgi:biotin-dependent carboxylase-like uncharacterized protein
MSDANRRYPRVTRASDSSLLVTFGDAVRRDHHRDVLRLFTLLRTAAHPGIRNLHPAYTSLLVSFDPLQTSPAGLEAHLRAHLDTLDDAPEPVPRTRIVPVCYGDELGPDLERVASAHRLAIEDVIRSRVSLSRRSARGAAHAALADTTRSRPRRQCRDRRRPHRHLSDRIAGRLAHHGPDSVAALATRQRSAAVDPDGRSSPFRADLAPPIRSMGRTLAMIHVLSAGLRTSVQDLGRPGWAHCGISASGAADPASLRLGNLLVGNPENAAGLEMTLVGGAFEFESATLAALAGSDFGATLAARAVPVYTAFAVQAGDVLRCAATTSGARCYLCVQGGIAVLPLLGSASTHLTSGLGGFEGRALGAGDRLMTGAGRAAASRLLRVRDDVIFELSRRTPIRVTPGPQAARAQWLRETYRVTEQSDRMGLRLDGPAIARQSTPDMLSEGIALGAIQVPPDGKPIVSFVEHQTTGGYPKIANVIGADLHRVGQLRPRDAVEFESVSWASARELLLAHEARVSAQSLEPA